MRASVPWRVAVPIFLLLAGCRYGIRDVPPAMFTRDENGSVIAYAAQCESEPNLYDSIELNRIDFARGSDGRVTRSEVTTIWRAAAANPAHPVVLPEQLPLLEAPPGMTADVTASEPDLDPEASYRLAAFGPDSIIAADFMISELREISGEFDLAGRRFDDPEQMRTYACSDEFADTWRNN